MGTTKDGVGKGVGSSEGGEVLNFRSVLRERVEGLMGVETSLFFSLVSQKEFSTSDPNVFGVSNTCFTVGTGGRGSDN